jgi:hypothetical protein
VAAVAVAVAAAVPVATGSRVELVMVCVSFLAVVKKGGKLLV